MDVGMFFCCSGERDDGGEAGAVVALRQVPPGGRAVLDVAQLVRDRSGHRQIRLPLGYQRRSELTLII